MNRPAPPPAEQSATARAAYEIRFSELLARLATTLIHRPDTPLDDLINDALYQIASFVGADRGYVFFYDASAGLARYSYEWCAPGISAQMGIDPVVHNQTLGEWVQRHQRGEAVVVDDVAGLGDLPIRRVLERQEVVSTAMVPMLQDGSCVGFCGFDSVRSRRRYSGQELRLLEVFAQMLVNLRLHDETRAALERERRRLEIIIEGTSAGTWIWWLDTDRLQVNDRWAAMLGYSFDELMPVENGVWRRLCHPEDLAHAEALLAQTASGALPYYEAVVRMRHREGHWVHVLSRGRVASWSDKGSGLIIAGIHQDITAQAKSRERLQQLSDIVEVSPTIAVVWRNAPGWPVSYATDNIRQLGHTAEAFIAGDVLYRDLIHPGDLPAIEEAVDGYIRHGPDEYRQAYRLLRPDGSSIWVDDHSWLLRDDDGEVLAIHGILMDDSARKQAEMALADSERRFRRLLEDIPNIAVQGYDQDLRLIFWNRGSELIYGWKAEEALGQSLLDLIIPTHMREDVETGARAWLSGGPAVAAGELVLRRRDGSPVPVYSSHALQTNGRGECEMYCIDIDMTAQKSARSRLELWASVFTHSHEAIFILDAERRIVEVNAAFTVITGHPAENAVDRPLDFLSAGATSVDRYRDMWRSLSRQGFWTGELPSLRRHGEQFEAFLTISAIMAPDGSVANYVGLFSDITTQKHYQQQLEYTAFYDALTGLANRTLLADRLRQAMSLSVRRSQPIALAFIDLDGFKSINDSFGHSVGDELLVAVGARLRSLVRESDTVGRMGGDEFVLLLLDLPESTVLEDFFARLARSLAEPIEVADHSLRISASMGVSFYPQGDLALDADQLLRQADQAMYEAKHAGKNRVVYFDSALDESEKQRRRQVERLSQAIDNDELVLYYQPKVDLRAGVATGVEALVRWQHPDGSLLAPGEFLHLAADEDNLSIKLGDWVLRRALLDFSALHRDLPDLGIGLNVNLDAAHLLSRDFAGRLGTALAQHPQLPEGFLRLEMLESSLIPDMDQAVVTMETCRRLGVRFALDDFGTGYSSLHYLKILPLDELKIDGGFVRDMLSDPDDLAIVRGVIDLGDAFGIPVVAEGVETAGHAAMLLRLGCAAAQGYGIAKPMPLAELRQWIGQWRPDPSWAALFPVNSIGTALLHAEVIHQAWIARVYACLSSDSLAPPVLEEGACRLTTWIETLPDHLLSSATLSDLRQLHLRVHDLARTLCETHAQRPSVPDPASLSALQESAAELQQLIRSLVAHVGMADGNVGRRR